MAEMRPPLSPTSNNVKRASEKGASQTSKKQRLGDTPLPFGAADQEPPPKDVAPREKPEKNDVEMTRGDARPTALVEEEENPVDTEDEAEEVMEPDDDEKQAAAGWLSKPKTVDATVAARSTISREKMHALSATSLIKAQQRSRAPRCRQALATYSASVAPMVTSASLSGSMSAIGCQNGGHAPSSVLRPAWSQ